MRPDPVLPRLVITLVVRYRQPVVPLYPLSGRSDHGRHSEGVGHGNGTAKTRGGRTPEAQPVLGSSEGAHMHHFATREYTAELMNLPTTWEHRVEACKVIPLEVHGISYLPKSCEDKVRYYRVCRSSKADDMLGSW